MTVVVDINVLLDVFEKRQPHFAESARVVSLVTAGVLTGVVPAHGLTTIYYLVRKHASKPDAETAVERVMNHFLIGNLSAAEWNQARQLSLDDFEDAVVAKVAEVTGSAFIITRNVGDFAGSSVRAITPADFLSQFAPVP